MKKIVLVGMFLLMASIVCADNSARIQELKNENEKLSEQVQRYQSFIQQAQVRIVSNNGAVAELQRLDTPKEEPKKE